MASSSWIRHLLILLLVVVASASAQLDSARAKIDLVARQARGLVGVAAIDLVTGDTLTVRRDDHFPMQSVYKFPLALAVLDRIDKGAMSLAQSVHIRRAELHPNTWSPLRDAHPVGDLDLSIDSLLAYVTVYSDNNACDILFRLIGGTGFVDRYVHKRGIADMAIVATEHEMHQRWKIQYRNWSSPLAMSRLLQLFDNGKILSPKSRDYLLRLLVSSIPGSSRIKGLLPSDAVVAHKTGSSGTDEKGIAAATNDIGILVTPGGRRVALVVFVSDSDASDEQRDSVIASIARAIWDAYSHP